MVVRRINGLVGLTGFSDKKMSAIFVFTEKKKPPKAGFDCMANHH